VKWSYVSPSTPHTNRVCTCVYVYINISIDIDMY
jgi:hypothetical protein